MLQSQITGFAPKLRQNRSVFFLWKKTLYLHIQSEKIVFKQEIKLQNTSIMTEIMVYGHWATYAPLSYFIRPAKTFKTTICNRPTTAFKIGVFPSRPDAVFLKKLSFRFWTKILIVGHYFSTH